jgi:hypothetical protein
MAITNVTIGKYLGPNTPSTEIVGLRIVLVIEDQAGRQLIQSVTVNASADTLINDIMQQAIHEANSGNIAIRTGSSPGTVIDAEVVAVYEGGLTSPAILM